MIQAKNLRSNMEVNIIGAIILLLAVFGLIVSTLGILSFTNSFLREYEVTTFHMADTAALLVNGDHLDDYLEGAEMDEYENTKKILDAYCDSMNVSLIYVIMVDTSDYGRFVSVYNCVDNAVDDTSYTPWEIGYMRDTTNDEYREKYRAVYEEGSEYETVYRIKTMDGNHSHITTMVPVKSASGEVTGILCVQRPVRQIYEARLPYLRSIGVSTVLLALIASLFTAWYIRKWFVDPIRKVSREATRFSKENTKGEELGDISPYEELSNLARSVDTMETDMTNYISNLTKYTSEQERIKTELTLANGIQTAVLPHTFPPFPDRTEFDIFASMDPAKDIGGDFYDFFMIDDDHLCLVMADVSGKGIPAALFMMASKIVVKINALQGKSPGEILTRTNTIICSNNQLDMFLTAWVGILEISTGKLTAANAGHEYPMLKPPDGGFQVFRDKHGFVIGGLAGMTYKEYELILQPGSKLFIYTDGLPEATDTDNRMFGMDRMTDALNEAADEAPEEVLKTVSETVKRFVGGAEQFDDLTMLCMQYNGPPADRPVKELTLEATTENIAAVTEFVDSLLEEIGCPLRSQTQIDVAIDEIVSNIAFYAYAPGTGEMTVRFETLKDPRRAILTFIDNGMPFDPLEQKDPDVTLALEERTVGGLGIFLVKKTMDHVSYRREDGKNILRIEKVV